MGKIRSCERCGQEAWMVVELMPFIPPLCLTCFEHITGYADFPKFVAMLLGSRSFVPADSLKGLQETRSKIREEIRINS